MTRQAGEEQILYFLDLLFQPADVRLCDTALSLDQAFDIVNASCCRFAVSPLWGSDCVRSQSNLSAGCLGEHIVLSRPAGGFSQ